MQTAAKSRVPFRNMSSQAWGNLAIASLAIFWAAQVIFDLAAANLFGRLGSDFASFWSAGYIANHAGYPAVYDLNLMTQVQEPLLPTVNNSPFVFHPIPTPYLPVFILPFQLLALLPPGVAAAAWFLLNFVGTVLYLRRFAREATGQSASTRLVLMLLVSAPVFLNLFTAQVNLVLMICIGEYVLATVRGDHLQAGAWLGGLLLKPQSLVLLIPAFFLQRSWRTILGMAISSGILLAASLLLGGLRSFQLLIGLWLGYAAGLPTNDPQLMMNWRMIGLQMEPITSAIPAWSVAAAGMLITTYIGLRTWLHQSSLDSVDFLVALTTIIAATNLVAWHSHVPAAMMLIPPLVALYILHRDLLGSSFEFLCFMPAGLYFVRLVLASMLHTGLLPVGASNFLDLLAGVGMFAMNIYFLVWGLRLISSRTQTVPEASPA